jgi:UDP-2,3-diacylglucosamine pyrophosphatase LpxH
MKDISEIAQLLMTCEDKGYTISYGDPLVKLDSQGKDILVVSDLHLASGKEADGKYSGTENFFSDSSFERFLAYYENHRSPKGAFLIVNGDFFDFLRVINVPQQESEFKEWKDVLQTIGISKTIEELKASVSKKEIIYGLKTDDFKSLWRIHTVIKGHPKFFSACAHWLSVGNSLVIIKGNHDLELYWPCIRNYIRLVIGELLSENNSKDILEILKEIIFPRLLFVDKALEIDQACYLEHGHRFDKYSHVVGHALIKNKRELNIPFGSFFNRYLINKIELTYPFFDNVRPKENLLPFLFKEHFFLGLKLLFQHIPFMLHIIPKRYYRYMFRRFLVYTLPILLMVCIVSLSMYFELQDWLKSSTVASFLSSKLLSLVMNPVKAILLIVLSYFITKITAYFQLVEPDSITKYAEKLLNNKNGYKLVVFGHTHFPDLYKQNDQWFYNSGTWISVIELSSAAIRHDKTYTFIHFTRGIYGNEFLHDIKRWNDDAGRVEALSLVKQKE